MNLLDKEQGTISVPVKYTLVGAAALGLGYGIYRAYHAQPKGWFTGLKQASKDIHKPDFVPAEAHKQHLATFIKKAHELNLHATTETSENLIAADNGAQFILQCKSKNDFGFFAEFLPASQATRNSNTNYVLYYKYVELLHKAKTIDLPHGAFEAFVKLVNRSIINKELEDILADQKLDDSKKASAIEKLIEWRNQL